MSVSCYANGSWQTAWVSSPLSSMSASRRPAWIFTKRGLAIAGQKGVSKPRPPPHGRLPIFFVKNSIGRSRLIPPHLGRETKNNDKQAKERHGQSHQRLPPQLFR